MDFYIARERKTKDPYFVVIMDTLSANESSEGARDFQTFNQHRQLCKNEEGSTNQKFPVQITRRQVMNV